MLRNRSALSVLQKTYDESYLTCSTAIYYESQGNEDEATRCWKTALDQIRDHNANRTITNYTPRSETESALVESLRQLELQCKERIDLLEALRLSRQDTIPSQSPSSSNLTGSTESCISPPEPGWIGDGTIPAITYAQLSRPEPPRRPSFKARESSEQATLGRSSSYGSSTTNSQPYSSAAPLPMAGNEHQSSRPASPERHTMRTTLRSGKSANKGPRLSSSRPVLSKPGEEPSKAASLAWAALGLRDSANAGNSSGQSSTTPTRLFEPHPFKEQQSKQWDSNSRRLVNSSPASALRRGPDATRLEYLARGDQTGSPDQELQSLSITAASSALVSYAAKDGVQNPSLESERVLHLHTSLQPHPPAKITRRPVDNIQANRHSKIDEEAMTTSSLTTIPVTVSLSKRVPTYETNNRTSMFTTEASHTHDVGRNTRRSLGGNRPSTGVVEVANSTAVFQPPRRRQGKIQKHASSQADTGSQSSDGLSDDNGTDVFAVWEKRRASILKTLPSGVDEHAAKQILNEIVVHGDQVHWGDIAGLDIAKNALREAVVYPFLRPDLFMGLREPARGMLLFGPPGTGKTMLARAVATESRSTFFSISATSLTSKYLGESEKLVRALFSLAKLLAPSIIFVDEIDSLLSQRSGSGEHEATRRIKTEFLIQWSDLQRAAAGREMGGKEKGREDANRVLVLAATNLPWAIDEAARRRFVRRQYIPLPEPGTRAIQLKTLLSQQKHTLSDNDIAQLVELTDGFSGSDITALAKDAAMGPLRSVGDALLHMTMDDIRPIELSDFTASLSNIRPSVNKEGLRAYEDWAREFGERGA